MVSDKLNKIEKFKRQIAALEKQVEKQRHKQLGGLYAKYGFASNAEFIAALQGLGAGKASAKVGKSSGKRFRAVITPELKKKVVELLKEGKTGEEVAESQGISLPSVYNIKKAAGLTKKRA